MAVYRMTGGGTLLATDANLTGSPILTGVPPGDFDPTQISQIAVEYSLAIVNHADDDWTENCKVTLTVGGVAVINNAGLAAIARSNGIFPFTYTETNPAAITAWSDPVLAAGDGTWVAYKKNKSNDGSTASISQVVIAVTYTPLIYPVASFTVDRRTVLTGQTVQFTDTSSGSPASWLWNFDGGAASSTEQNPLVTFTTVGDYFVTLTATNGVGSDTSAPTVITVQVREAEIWNGSAWVGGESWNGAAWVVPEVWDGVQWIPIKAPA